MAEKVRSYNEPIDILSLSKRSLNALHRSGVHTLEELINMPLEELHGIKYLGDRSIAEITSMKDSVIRLSDKLVSVSRDYLKPSNNFGGGASDENDTYTASVGTEVNIAAAWEAAVEFMRKIIPFNDRRAVFEDFRRRYSEAEITSTEDFINNESYVRDLFTLRSFVEELVEFIIDAVSGSDDGIGDKELRERFGFHPIVKKCCGELIDNMLASGKIEYAPDGSIVKKLPSVFDYVNTLYGTDRIIADGVLDGRTLEDIGRQIGITRERVRQRKKLILKRLPPLRERFFRKVFEKYNIECADFTNAFSVTQGTYHFLEWCYIKGEANIKDLLTDEEFNEYFRNAADRIIYRDYLIIGSKRVKKQRLSIIDGLIECCAVEEMTTRDFLELYNDFLRKNGLLNESRLTFTVRYLENRLSENRNVLYKRGKCFRFYPVDRRDYTELKEMLAFWQYRDAEYSTLYFFRLYPELMEKYDIRDEYELHNLLKKVYGEDNEEGISFGRMPHMEFGEVNRDNQVIDLLMENAPITTEELAVRYEETYGVKREVALNYFKCIDEYCYNGVYSVDYVDLPENEAERMRELMTGEFYMISEVRNMYHNEFPESKVSMINSYTLKMLGFKVYSGYVVNGKYLSVTRYIEDKFSGKDVIDLRTFPERLLNIGVFYSQLGKHKREYEIVEFAPKQYVHISKLAAQGITKQKIREFVENLSQMIEPGEYFTIYSLIRRKILKKFKHVKYNEYFYASLVEASSKTFSNCRVGIRNDERLFIKGRGGTTMRDFLRWILGDTCRFHIKQLESRIGTEFGIVAERHRLIEALRELSLEYDRRTKMVYPVGQKPPQPERTYSNDSNIRIGTYNDNTT